MTPPVKVKICGITNRDDARAAADAGAAMLGFNFCERSPRCVTATVAAAIVRAVPRDVITVGVFADAPRSSVEAIVESVGLTAVQLHGDEPPAYCRAWTPMVIKAFRVRDAQAAVHARAYDVDFVLADAYVEGHLGGTGVRIATQLLSGFDRQRLILAGGLTADSVAAAVRAVRPHAVDVASGIERAPGKKDWALMKRFIANALAA